MTAPCPKCGGDGPECLGCQQAPLPKVPEFPEEAPETPPESRW